MQDVQEAVINIFIQDFGFHEGMVKPQTEITELIELDSSESMRLCAALEVEFDMPFSDENVRNCKTIQDIIDYIKHVKE